MFEIQLLSNTSERIVVNKNVTHLGTMTGTLREGCDVVNPVLHISADLTGLATCNYVYIPIFGRYYFAKLKSLTENIIEITCKTDPLMSWKSQLLTNSGIIKRQENKWNLYLNDGSFRTYANPKVVTKKFPVGFEDDAFYYVLICAGGS